MRWKIRKFFRWFKKCIEYSIFLWEDEDWTDWCILRLLQYKLKRTREHIVDHAIIEATNRKERQIKYAEFLLSKLMEGDLLIATDLRDKHEEKWGICSLARNELTKGYYECLFWYEKAKTEEENEKARQESLEISLFEEKMYKNYKKRLYRHLERYLDGWWD